MANPATHQTVDRSGRLQAELRREPFRPILVEELLSLNPELKADPIPKRISKDGYRALYTEAFEFTYTRSGLSLTFFEVGFSLGNDGSVRQTGISKTHNRIMKKFLMAGLAEVHRVACASWEAKAKRLGFDPNNEENFLPQGWIDLIAPIELSDDLYDPDKKILSSKERGIFEDDIIEGLFGFHFRDGYCLHTSTPCSFKVDNSHRMIRSRNPHSHLVTHSVSNTYFPSGLDENSPVIWTIVDIDFIRTTVGGDSSEKTKIEAIIEHHVRGMDQAFCIGTLWDGQGVWPIVRT